MEIERPDPDKLLAIIQKQEERAERGKLKVFLGMVAGVGKTYAMLQSAQQRLHEGVDVVIGYVETHGRLETQALVNSLPQIPRKRTAYRGTILEEMDTDAILARRPTLVLVDELAHSNRPTARHPKRYQDIIELIEVGIDVYTTVNVQHFESRVDTVRQITGVRIRETVPDSFLDSADELELIDLPPEELRQRLLQGKVYTNERIENALNNFFRIGNLTALREMALRLTAERVDHQLQDYMESKRIDGPWKSADRLMVAISPSPLSEQLIRWTRRMAYSLEASWIAVYSQRTPDLPHDDQERLNAHFELIRQLGGELVITSGNNISKSLLQVAKQRNVTQIIVGKPFHQPSFLFFKKRSLVDELIEQSGNIDIYVVRGEQSFITRRSLSSYLMLNTPISHYLWGVAIIGLVTILNLFMIPFISYQGVGLIELFAVILIAIYLGRGPALVIATISAISWDFLFIPPRFTFVISKPEDIIFFMMYFMIALVVGNLAARIRDQERLARYHSERTTALYHFSQEVAKTVTLEESLEQVVSQLNILFGVPVLILIPNLHGAKTFDHYSKNYVTLDDREQLVIDWVFQKGKMAGRFTDTLPSANGYYIPLKNTENALGVLGMIFDERPNRDEQELLHTFVSHITLLLEREKSKFAWHQANMIHESERLYTTLLNSISHELRTPISTITGASSSLLHNQISDHAKHELIQDIQESAERLNRLVANLLDMSRLEGGQLKLKKDWCEVSDLIGTVANRIEKRLKTHQLHIHISPDLPLVELDFVLLEQALHNLLENAIAYTPDTCSIWIKAERHPPFLYLIVEDNGLGISDDELTKIFDKFYRINGTQSGGTGLGLSIVRGIVEAHNGIVEAHHRVGGGLQFIIKLPLSRPPDLPKELIS